MASLNIEVQEHRKQRIIVTIDEELDAFRVKFEQQFVHGSAPDIAKGKTWAEAVEYVESKAPFGLILYRDRDVYSVMRLNGATQKCHYYLIGNFTQVADAYKADPSIFTYAPFHWCLFEDKTGKTKLSFDRPRLLFVQFEQAPIRKVGPAFDHKVAALLKHLNCPVPDVLTEE